MNEFGKTMTHKCIICRKAFDPRNTRPEHVLLNALGGRKKTRSSICSNCNQLAGTTIDNSLAEQVEGFRNFANWKSGDGDDAPMLVGVDTVTEEKINIHADGTPDDRKVEFEVEKVEGGIRFKGGITSYDRLVAMIPNIAKKLGVSEDVVLEKLTENGLTVQVRRPPVVKLSFDASEPSSMASTCKMCFVLWSELVGNQSASSAKYDSTASYLFNVMREKNPSNPTTGSINAKEINSIALPTGHDWGPCWNLLHVFSDQNGIVRGWFRLYNSVNYFWSLGTDLENSNRSITLISNPDTQDWDLAENQNLEVDFNALIGTPAIREEFESAVGRIMSHVYEKHQKANTEKVISEAIFEALPEGEDQPSEDHLADVARRIAEAVVSQKFDKNYEKHMSKEKALKMISDRKKKKDDR